MIGNIYVNDLKYICKGMGVGVRGESGGGRRGEGGGGWGGL